MLHKVRNSLMFAILTALPVADAVANAQIGATGGPENGEYIANTVYPNAATIENLGDAIIQNNATVYATPIWVADTYECAPGQYLPMDATECAICPNDNYCPGGEYTFNETAPQGMFACDTGLVAPMGSDDAGDCGHIMHIGDDVMYLRSVKRTSPSLNVQIGDRVFYGNMSTEMHTFNAGTTRKLKAQINDTIYYIYDDTGKTSPASTD